MPVRYIQVMTEHFLQPRKIATLPVQMRDLTSEQDGEYRIQAGREYAAFSLALILVLFFSASQTNLRSQVSAHSGVQDHSAGVGSSP